ncbi:MAG: hypothetical protein HRU70_00515 [Phycisphaeraceae bacterium]|nr:MAG: hypothetical protein HRU70_00515 [Phycisphaeraceae bacterium]
MSRPGRIGVSSAVTLCASIASAQPFTRLPDLYTADRSSWRSIFARAHDRPVHGLLLGDSQETCPQGAGSVYVIALHAEFARHYGGCGMTPLSQAGKFFGGANPPGEWLVRGANAQPGPVPDLSSPALIPPGLRVATTSSNNGTNVNNDQRYGWLVVLDHDAAWADRDALAQGPWFDLSQGFFVDVFALTSPGSSQLRLRISHTERNPYYTAAATAIVTSSMSLDAPAGQARRQTFGPFFSPPGAKPQVEISGDDPARTAKILSARFRSAAAPRGIVLTDLAEGGYRAASVLQNHPACGPVLAALDADFAMIAFGANESGNGIPLAEYRDSLLALIALVRGHTRADLPIILAPDVYRVVSPAYTPILEGLAGVCYQIALDDPRVLFLNSPKLTDAIGWNAQNAAVFLADAVHYTPLGAREKARLEAQTLLRAFACPADFNGDGFIDLFDIDAYITAFEDGDPDADFDADGFLDFFDLDGYVAAFDLGC